MGRELRRKKERNKLLKKKKKITEYPEDVLIVHYSCESFYKITDGRTPRVTSIAIRNLESAQTESFSIHKVAEQCQIPFDQITEKYDQLEKQMLEEYFAYLQENSSKTWVHWNMRDTTYGFFAIEHRLKALAGTPVQLPESKKLDLGRGLVTIYGKNYTPHPRLETLIAKNEITNMAFLGGAEEAEAFENKEYVKLHQSTLRKVDILANIFERVADNTLLTDSKWYEVFGMHPKVVVELIKEHWFYSLLGLLGLMFGLLRGVGVL